MIAAERRAEQERLRLLAAKAKVARRLFKLLDSQGVDPMLGTRHAAENSYCLWCEPKGYDHWYDQEEHAHDCEFVSVMAQARRLFAK
jgi:hypothetical protein